MRVRTLAAGLAWIAGTVAAGAQPVPVNSAPDAAMAACGTIDNRRSRLDCYDAMARIASPSAVAAAPSGGATGPAVEPTFNTGRGRSAASAGARAPATGDSFGLDMVRQSPSRRASRRGRMEVRVASAVDDGVGHWIVTLDSGATWQMTEAVPNFRAPAAGSEITLRRNRFGSYFMDVDGQAGARVMRLR